MHLDALARRRTPAQRRLGERACRFEVRAGRGQYSNPAGRQIDDQSDGARLAGLVDRGHAFALQQRRHRRRVHQPPHDRIVAIDPRADVAARARAVDAAKRDVDFGTLRRGAERVEHAARFLELVDGLGARACRRRELAKLQVPERGLVALAEKLEDADALAEVVVRLGRLDRRRREGDRAAAGTHPRSRSWRWGGSG